MSQGLKICRATKSINVVFEFIKIMFFSYTTYFNLNICEYITFMKLMINWKGQARGMIRMKEKV